MNDIELNRRELTGDDALRFARESGMEQAARGLFYAGVGDLIRFARLVRTGWTPPRPEGACGCGQPAGSCSSCSGSRFSIGGTHGVPGSEGGAKNG